MKIISSDVNLEMGFAHVELEGGMFIQACLMQDKAPEGKMGEFLPQVSRSDSGMNWGLCGDANEKAFATLGKELATKIFFDSMSNIGVEVQA